MLRSCETYYQRTEQKTDQCMLMFGDRSDMLDQVKFGTKKKPKL